VATLADVIWGSFLAGVLAVPILDVVVRLVAYVQRSGVGHFRTLDRGGR
jgi:hypothetical protein